MSKKTKKDIHKQIKEISDKIWQLDHHMRMLDIERATCELEQKKLDDALLSLEHQLETGNYDA